MTNTRWRAARAILTVVLAFASTRCDDAQCERLRDELTSEKLTWQSCAQDADCVLVGGNTRDCTGVFACDFAVHRGHRLNAERRVLSLPEETRDCLECAGPNCVSGSGATCDPTTRTCTVAPLASPAPTPGAAQGGGPSVP